MTEILLTGTLSQKHISGTPSECLTVWIQIRTDRHFVGTYLGFQESFSSYQLTSRDITAISQLLSAVRVTVLLMHATLKTKS